MRDFFADKEILISQNYKGVFCCFCELISEGIIKSEKFTKNFFNLVVKRPEIIPSSYEGKNLLVCIEP